MSKVNVGPSAGYTKSKNDSFNENYPNTIVEAVYWDEKDKPLSQVLDETMEKASGWELVQDEQDPNKISLVDSDGEVKGEFEQPDITVKQDVLVSGENIKTINGASILGGGDIVVTESGVIPIDSAISANSTNAVQNKIVKSYVDTEVSALGQELEELEMSVNNISNTVALVPGNAYTNSIYVNLNEDDKIVVKLSGAVTTNRIPVRAYKNNTMVQEFGILYADGEEHVYTLAGDTDEIRAMSYLTGSMTSDDITLTVWLNTSLYERDKNNEAAIAGINAKIPATASSTNKMTTDADMDWMELKTFPKSNTVALVPGSAYENVVPIVLESGKTVNVRLEGNVQTNYATIRTYKNNTLVQDFGPLYVGSNKDITLTGDADQVRALNFVTGSLTADSITLVVGVPGYHLPTMNDIQKVDGKFIVVNEQLSLKSDKTLSSNIYDWRTAETYKYIIENGSIRASLNENYAVSDYIRVYGNNVISNARIDDSTKPMYNVYDVNKTLLRTIIGNRQYTYQAGDCFIRIAFANWKDGIANYGTTLQPFERYDEHYWLLSRLNGFYAKPALSLVDDDFSYNNQTQIAQRTAFHDALVAAGMRCDFAVSSDMLGTQAAKDLAHQWETEGFQLVVHPKHQGWYTHTPSGMVKNLALARAQLVPDIINTRNEFAGRQRIIIYPGSSGDDPEVRAMVREYFDAGVAWNNGVNYEKPTYGDSRFYIKRFNMQLGEGGQLTKTQVKAGIDEAFANNAWVVLGMHAHRLDLENTQSDENTFNVTNMMEILNYAVSKFGEIRHIEDVWEERKPLYDYLGI